MEKSPRRVHLKTGGPLNRFCGMLGVSLMIAGVVLNEWVIRVLSRGEAHFAEIEKRIFLLLVELALVVLGFLIYRYRKVALQNLLLLIGSIFFTFGILEIALRLLPANLEAEAPVWIPYEQKMINARINQGHQARARLNRHGFNDREHAFGNPPGVKRIAVLGDSFVWGVGVEEQVIWTHKLERLLNQKGMPTEILHWGKPGWSTLDQFRFLKADGIRYAFDLLLVGWVTNDPMMDESLNIKRFIYDGGIIDRIIVQPVSRYLFPNAISLCVDLTNAFFDTFFGYGYANWMEKVYSEDNLNRYQALLKEMARYCQARGIELLFVMTPENHHPAIKSRFDRIAVLLRNAGIPYLDLYPVIHAQLHHIPGRKLWANPADGHPGDAITDLLSRSVYQHLANLRDFQPRGRGKQ